MTSRLLCLSRLSQIFIADIEEVESLPRHAVALHLEHLDKIGPQVCQVYLEHIIHVLHEDGPEFHEKLIELYLEDVKHGDPEGQSPKLDHLLRCQALRG